jgi:hypothetical protein
VKKGRRTVRKDGRNEERVERRKKMEGRKEEKIDGRKWKEGTGQSFARRTIFSFLFFARRC